MRVVSFNIHHGTVGENGPVDVGRLADVCASFDADLIALQEVERGTPRTWRVDLVARIADACSMTYVARPAQRLGLGWQGNALLVRGTIDRWTATRLPRVPVWNLLQERRMVLDADVTIGGQSWAVTTTHLAVQPDVGARQLDVVLSGRAERIVLGDLNLAPDAVRPAAARAGMDFVDHGPTFPADRPTMTIDHVVVPRSVRVDAVEVRGTPISDHAALLVDLGHLTH
jgi:endonuclease/exonuclease/phosphatase family metal-dependent hydrolase